MRSLSLQVLLERAEERANEDKKAAIRILQKTQAALLSIRRIIEKFPDKSLYEESKAEASFRAKVLGLLDDIALPSEPETSTMERFINDLNNFQVEVSRTGARLIPKFDRGRKLDVAELELNMRGLAKVAAQLQNTPKETLRHVEEAKHIVERIRSQTDELKKLEGEKDSVISETMKLRDEDARLSKEMAELDDSELSSKIKNINAEVYNARQKSEALFAPIVKPIEKLRKLLKDQGAQESQIEPLLKCVENPMELSKIELVDLEKAGQILRSYIEKGELSIKRSRSRRALEAISEIRSKAPHLKEKLGFLLNVREEVLNSPEAATLSAKRKTIEDRLRQIEHQLVALAIDQTNLDDRLEKCSLKMEHLKREAEKLAGSIVSEPVSLDLSIPTSAG